jgi:hypothetical protein
MSKDIKITRSVNFFKNFLKQAKVQILDRTSIEDDDLIDKKYVDDSQIYDSELGNNASVEFKSIENIDDKSKVVGKPTTQIFDELFFPLINHSYQLPESDVDIVVEDTLSSLDVTSKLLEVGQSIHFDVDNIVQINDSKGLLATNPYEYNIETDSGVQVNQSNLSSYQSPDIAVSKETKLYVVSKYQEAETKKDSHGNDDLTGTVENPKFVAGQLDSEYIIQARWPKFVGIFSGSQTTPDANTLMSTLSSADFNVKLLEDDDTTLNTTQDVENSHGTKTLMFAIPKDPTATGFSIQVIRGQEDISSLFTEETIVDVPDSFGNGYTQSYVVFSAELPLTITESYKIKSIITKLS